MNTVIHISSHEVTLAIKRDVPATAWPYGEQLDWERFAFPRRCLDEVSALAGECKDLSFTEARELIRDKRRAIQWPYSYMTTRSRWSPDTKPSCSPGG